MPEAIDPIRPADDQARALARKLLDEATFAALAVLGPDGAPSVSRCALGMDATGAPVSLVSHLSAHTRALAADPRASLLVGEPGERGDPLTHPRLTLQVLARIIDRDQSEHEGLAEGWLTRHPKARLYIGFADFRFVRFQVTAGFLNGGFGQAFRLTPEELGR